MPISVNVQVLNVGQSSGNLIECYDGATVQTQKNVFTTIYFVADQEQAVLFPPKPATAVFG